MLHYHGTPITPRTVLHELAGRSFCVRYGEHRDDAICHQIGQSVMLDNGAFSFWTKKQATDWDGFITWAKPWLDHWTTWAVMPDVIDGDEEDNDRLISWLFKRDPEVHSRSAPVWHMHESIDRLKRLCQEHAIVCIGSSGEYADPNASRWRRRMETAMDELCGNGPAPTRLHMLRAMKQAAGGPYPFYSADSTNIARNHAGSHRQRARSPRAMADELDSRQSAGRWRVTPSQLSLAS